MNWEEQVRGLWEAYIAKTEQLERDKKPGAGILGLTPGPKDDACHDQFAADAEGLLADMLAAAPSSAETLAALEYIYEAPLEHRQPLTAYWMLQAVHRLTVPVISLLAPEDAGPLRARYAKIYRRRERLPAQKAVLAALTKREKE